MMSGGSIRKFQSGWAVALFGGRCAHWFVRRNVSPMADALCGRKTVVVSALRGPGTFIHCKTCERLSK
jgi:hypothetical protein